MNKELEKIRQNSKVIMGDYPEDHDKLLKQLISAQDDLRAAQAEKDSATDLNEFDAAVDKVSRAEMRVDFIRAAIRKLNSQPRMEEAEYIEAVEACERLMNEAVAKYRTQALAIMEDLQKIRADFEAKAEEINDTLIALDDAANVLQSKSYDTGSTISDDWRTHAIRFEAYKAFQMATSCDEEARRKNPAVAHDSVLSAAWFAVTKAFPRKAF